MSQVVHYKLVSGEEIIAKFVNENGLGEKIVLSDVRVIMVQPAQNGQMGLVMFPWIAGNPDGEVTISTSSIVAQPGKVPAQLEKEYLQRTSSIDLSATLG